MQGTPRYFWRRTAVALGVSITGFSAWANIWIYLVANFAAGATAAVVFKAVNPAD